MRTPKIRFDPVNKKRAFEEVASMIKKLIFEGSLKHGDKLPSEAELANQFEVSRQTIREALRLLETTGFISIQKGGSGGPIISDTIFNSINSLFIDAFRMRKISIEEFISARLEIEKVVLDAVLSRAQKSDILRLKENIRIAKKKLAQDIIATEENIQFIELMAASTRNHVFVIVMGALMAILRDLLSRIAPDLEKSKNAVQYREDLVEAIEHQNREKAFSLLEQHLMEVKNRYLTLRDQE